MTRLARFIREYAILLNGKLNDIKNTINARLQFRDKAAEAWQQLQRPISLGSDIYFTATLTGATLSPVSAVNNKIALVGGISGKAKVIVGGPVPQNPTPLPPLQIANNPPGLNLELPVSISYDALSDYLNHRLAKHRYPYGDRAVEIDSISVYGTSEKLVVQVDGSVSGVAQATLYLTGRPEYDSLRKIVYVKDLDYTVETKNVLVKLADWLLHQDFQKSLEGEAQYPVSDRIDEIRGKASAALNRTLSPHADLSGSVGDLSILGFALSGDQITVYLSASGTATVKLH
jgi:hypothetical protein